MTLNKDNIQKIILGAMMGGGLLYAYFNFLLGPLNTSEAAALREIKKLEPDISGARAQIKRTKSIEAGDPNAAAAAEVWVLMNQRIPKGATVAWVPQKLSDFFKRSKIEKANFKLNSEALDNDLPGYKASFWSIEIPKVDYVKLGNAIEALENEEGLLQVQAVDIDSQAGEILEQRAQVTISILANAK
jgi:hypothetical protein